MDLTPQSIMGIMGDKKPQGQLMPSTEPPALAASAPSSLKPATASHTTVILPHPWANRSVIYNIVFFKSSHLWACLLCHARRGALSQECLIVPLRTGDFPSVHSHMCIQPRLPPGTPTKSPVV